MSRLAKLISFFESKSEDKPYSAKKVYEYGVKIMSERKSIIHHIDFIPEFKKEHIDLLKFIVNDLCTILQNSYIKQDNLDCKLLNLDTYIGKNYYQYEVSYQKILKFLMENPNHDALDLLDVICAYSLTLVKLLQ